MAMLSILCLLYLFALVATIASMLGKCPLAVPVLLISIGLLLGCLPLR
jgi:hypothetical protein